MTATQFRELLTSYLTEPEYAQVVAIGDAMDVTLDDGTRFLVKIDGMPAREVAERGQ